MFLENLNIKSFMIHLLNFVTNNVLMHVMQIDLSNTLFDVKK